MKIHRNTDWTFCPLLKHNIFPLLKYLTIDKIVIGDLSMQKSRRYYSPNESIPLWEEWGKLIQKLCYHSLIEQDHAKKDGI